MTVFHSAIAERRFRAAVRLLAAGALAGLLAGCQTQVAQQGEYPNDYRQRHPITLKEGQHTVDVFLGRNRGGLNPSQRADVLAFAQLWRREATSGIIIDVPKGGQTDHAAADSMREIHSILAASGVPSNAVYVRSYAPSPTSLASIKINYSKLSAQAGPPAASGRAISARVVAQATPPTSRTGISVAPASATLPPWSIIRPIWRSRAAKHHPIRRAVRWRSTTIARARTHPEPITATTPARSAI